MANLEQIQKLREETSASMADVKKALDEAKGDEVKALELLRERGKIIAAKKSLREASDGLIFSYLHTNGKVGVLLELKCETDFVAKTDEFNILGKDLCMHITAMKSENVAELLEQPFVKNQDKKVSDLIIGVIAKVGENVAVGRFVRYEI